MMSPYGTLGHGANGDSPADQWADIPVRQLRPVPPLDDDEDDAQELELGSWAPIDLVPYLDGTVERLEPTVGMTRTDGVGFLYPGKEHAIIGETECGKSWFCLGSALAEMEKGNIVVYVHFEEADPSGSVERLLLLGATREDILERFVFVGPHTRITEASRAALLALAPSLVILDGVNEAMALHGHGIYDPDGVARFRGALVKPWQAIGAAVLSADHVVKSAENRGRDAFGSIHKGNALDGSRILVENVRPFGRGQNGMSRIFVTKDRPGAIRAHGQAGSMPGKTYMGDLVVNDDREDSFNLKMALFPPKAQDDEALTRGKGRDLELEAGIVKVIEGQPGRTVESFRAVRTRLQDIGMGRDDAPIRKSLDAMVVHGLLVEEEGPRKSKRYSLPPAG